MSIRSAASRSMYSIDFRIATVVRPGGSSTDASKSWRLAIARTLIDVQSREPRDRCAGHLEVLGVHLNANARQPQSSGGGNGRARTHEGVENHAFAQGQGGPHKLPQEVLRLQRRMGRQSVLRSARRQGVDQISKRLQSRDSAETTGPPLAEVVLNSSFARLAEEAPTFPT